MTPDSVFAEDTIEHVHQPQVNLGPNQTFMQAQAAGLLGFRGPEPVHEPRPAPTLAELVQHLRNLQSGKAAQKSTRMALRSDLAATKRRLTEATEGHARAQQHLVEALGGIGEPTAAVAVVQARAVIAGCTDRIEALTAAIRSAEPHVMDQSTGHISTVQRRIQHELARLEVLAVGPEARRALHRAYAISGAESWAGFLGQALQEPTRHELAVLRGDVLASCGVEL